MSCSVKLLTQNLVVISSAKRHQGEVPLVDQDKSLANYFDWYAAKRGLDLWERRFRILSGVKV